MEGKHRRRPSTTLLILMAVAAAPLWMAVAMLNRALDLRGVEMPLHPEDLIIAFQVSAAVLLGSVLLLALRRWSGRPIPLEPLILSALLFSVGLLVVYTLEPGRLQRQLAIAEGSYDLVVRDEQFRAQYGSQAPIDFDNDRYLDFVNREIDRHNERLREEARPGEDVGTLRPLVRLEETRGYAGPVALLALALALGIVALAAFRRGAFVAIFSDAWPFLLLGGLGLQAATLGKNLVDREEAAALITLGGYVTSPLALLLLVLGLGAYLGVVSAGVNTSGALLRGMVPRMRLLGLWPYWGTLILSVGMSIAQRDLGSALVLLLTIAVPTWTAFSPRRTGLLLGLGLAAVAVVGAYVAQGGLSSYTATAMARLEMAWRQADFYREQQALNSAVAAYRQLARHGDAPVAEQVAVVNGYLDRKYCEGQPLESELTAVERSESLQRCADDRRKIWGEGLPRVDRNPTRFEFEVASDLWWGLRSSGLPETRGLAEGLKAVQGRLRDAVFLPEARWMEQDNRQQLLVAQLLMSADLVGHGMGRTGAWQLPNADTDFPAAVVADQLGAMGFLALCLGLTALVTFGIAAGVRAGSSVERLVASAAAAHLGAYAAINLGATLGLPATGVPLPFVSRGGTLLIAAAVLVGIITAVAAWPEDRAPADGRRRARALIVRTSRWLRWPPVPLALLIFPAATIMLLALVRPMVLTAAGQPVDQVAAGLPTPPWAAPEPPMAARILLLSPTGEIAIADRALDGSRRYPVPQSEDPSDPGQLALGLASVMGLLEGGPVAGIEQLYRQGVFGEVEAPAEVVTTIWSDLQAAMTSSWLEVASEVAQNPEDPRGGYIVMEGDTGAVRALGSFPRPSPEELTDPERLRQMAYEEEFPAGDGPSGQPFLNRPLRGLYTPGSVAKLITMACAIETGVVDESTLLNDPGEITEGLGGAKVKHDNIPARLKGEQEDWNLFEAIAWSLNGALARAAHAVGPDSYSACVQRLGVVTGPSGSADPLTSLPHEPAHLPRGSLDSPQLFVDAGYGQGRWLTSLLHMAVIYAGVTSDGVLPRAHIVEGLRGADGTFVRAPDAEGSEWRRGWSPETNRLLARALIQSATEGDGWAGKNAPELLHRSKQGPTGAKTGTAQLDPGLRSHSWVAVVSPIGTPHALVFVVLIENGGEGALGALQVVDRALERVDVDELLARSSGPR